MMHDDDDVVAIFQQARVCRPAWDAKTSPEQLEAIETAEFQRWLDGIYE